MLMAYFGVGYGYILGTGIYTRVLYGYITGRLHPGSLPGYSEVIP